MTGEQSVVKETPTTLELQNEITHKDIEGLDLPFDYRNMDTLTIEQAEMFEEALACKTSSFREGYNGLYDLFKEYLQKKDFPYKEDRLLLKFLKMLHKKSDKDKPFSPKEWLIALNFYYNSKVWDYNELLTDLKTSTFQSFYMDIFTKPRQIAATKLLINSWKNISNVECPAWLIEFNKFLTGDDTLVNISAPSPDLKVEGEMYDYLYKNCVSICIELFVNYLEETDKMINEMIDSMPEEEEQHKNYESSDDEE